MSPIMTKESTTGQRFELNQNNDQSDEEDQPLEGFRNQEESLETSFESVCFLKT